MPSVSGSGADLCYFAGAFIAEMNQFAMDCIVVAKNKLNQHPWNSEMDAWRIFCPANKTIKIEHVNDKEERFWI